MIDPLDHHNRTFRHHVNGVDIHVSTHAHELSEGPPRWRSVPVTGPNDAEIGGVLIEVRTVLRLTDWSTLSPHVDRTFRNSLTVDLT